MDLAQGVKPPSAFDWWIEMQIVFGCPFFAKNSSAFCYHKHCDAIVHWLFWDQCSLW
jgi:hypothetical protein